MSAYQLLVPTQILNIPIHGYAMLIEQQWGHCLQPNKSGVYLVGHLEPILVPEKRYYKQEKQPGYVQPLVQVNNFDSHNGDVYDSHGNLVLSASVMKHKETMLSLEPTVPVRSLKIIELLINSYLSSKLKHIRYNVFSSKIDNYLKPEHQYLSSEGYLEMTCSGLFNQIIDFIGRDDWHIYNVKLNTLDIRIEKTIDYRIFQYELNQETNND
jgi:hypothetical protein